ncbi:MAG: hypothetical protein SPG65_01385, partial [Campylobacter sp.]|nr:hypothetical protein [Campylobacter sp.]
NFSALFLFLKVNFLEQSLHLNLWFLLFVKPIFTTKLLPQFLLLGPLDGQIFYSYFLYPL